MANIRHKWDIRDVRRAFSEQALLERLVSALRDIPDASVQRHEFENEDPGHDGRVELTVRDRQVQLLVECKREFLPAQAKEIHWQFRHQLGGGGPR
jgi:hypothetical protein